MENKKSIDSIIFREIKNDTEVDFLDSQSMMFIQINMTDDEYTVYIDNILMYQKYNQDMPLSKYMACKDSIAYFRSNLQPVNKN